MSYPTSSPELVKLLQEMYLAAGAPTYRQMARAIGFSHTTCVDTMKGRTGNWIVIERLITFFGGDVEKARKLWIASNTNRNVRFNPQSAAPQWVKEMLSELSQIRELLAQVVKLLQV